MNTSHDTAKEIAVVNGEIELWVVVAFFLKTLVGVPEKKDFYFVDQKEATAWAEKLRANGRWDRVEKERKVLCPIGRAWVGYTTQKAGDRVGVENSGRGAVFLFPNAWCREQIHSCADSAIRSMAHDEKFISWELEYKDFVGGGDIAVEDYEKNGWRVLV